MRTPACLPTFRLLLPIAVSTKNNAQGTLSMELSISDEKTKELLRNKQGLIYDMRSEALEEVGLANAITEGRTEDFVSEDEVLPILERTAE